MNISSWDDVATAMPEGVTARVTCRWFPVQVQGEIVGHEYYFRGRHGLISLGVGGEPVGAPAWKGHYADENAGCLTPAETVAALLRLIDEWRRR